MRGSGTARYSSLVAAFSVKTRHRCRTVWAAGPTLPLVDTVQRGCRACAADRQHAAVIALPAPRGRVALCRRRCGHRRPPCCDGRGHAVSAWPVGGAGTAQPVFAACNLHPNTACGALLAYPPLHKSVASACACCHRLRRPCRCWGLRAVSTGGRPVQPRRAGAACGCVWLARAKLPARPASA